LDKISIAVLPLRVDEFDFMLVFTISMQSIQSTGVNETSDCSELHLPLGVSILPIDTGKHNTAARRINLHPVQGLDPCTEQ
jgi:hypothetical protein